MLGAKNASIRTAHTSFFLLTFSLNIYKIFAVFSKHHNLLTSPKAAEKKSQLVRNSSVELGEFLALLFPKAQAVLRAATTANSMVMTTRTRIQIRCNASFFVLARKSFLKSSSS